MSNRGIPLAVSGLGLLSFADSISNSLSKTQWQHSVATIGPTTVPMWASLAISQLLDTLTRSTIGLNDPELVGKDPRFRVRVDPANISHTPIAQQRLIVAVAKCCNEAVHGNSSQETVQSITANAVNLMETSFQHMPLASLDDFVFHELNYNVVVAPPGGGPQAAVEFIPTSSTMIPVNSTNSDPSVNPDDMLEKYVLGACWRLRGGIQDYSPAVIFLTCLACVHACLASGYKGWEAQHTSVFAKDLLLKVSDKLVRHQTRTQRANQVAGQVMARKLNGLFQRADAQRNTDNDKMLAQITQLMTVVTTICDGTRRSNDRVQAAIDNATSLNPLHCMAKLGVLVETPDLKAMRRHVEDLLAQYNGYVAIQVAAHGLGSEDEPSWLTDAETTLKETR
jgi:hypothetical protein